MQLRTARVLYFKNIVNSGNVSIDDAVTCLVGKNESGKTAFLHALYRLNPIHDTASFSVQEHYPAWLEKRHRLQGKTLEDVTPISATFSLESREQQALIDRFGQGCITNPDSIRVGRKYDGGLEVGLQVSEQAFVRHVVGSISWPRGTKTEANKAKTIAELRSYGEQLRTSTDTPEHSDAGHGLLEQLQQCLGDEDTLWRAVWRVAKQYLPKFLYFSDYSRLPYTTNINRILTAPTDQLDHGEMTARSLLRLAAADDAYINNPDYERRKRELENVANAITSDVLQYWSQNPELRVQPDITQRTVEDQRGRHSVLDELKIRVWDNRHLLSLPFSEHSTGFQWFFSFLAAFSEYEHKPEPLILLLDEPALGLHARAQKDFLRFIDERLAPARQVIYSTHSPFMVEPRTLERVRLVEDTGQELGALVSDDVTSTDPDTLFPLQGALGYDLAQHLFIAPHNLVVEGTSDVTYLQILSDHLTNIGRNHLDVRWSIVPVGGADLVPTFVALLGHHLDVTVVVDGKKGSHQKLNRIADAGILTDNRIITIADLLKVSDADVEDLFDLQDYLVLFNGAMKMTVGAGDIGITGPVARRLARLMNVQRFDHGKPADYLLRRRDAILPTLSDATLDRFESLFERVNATLTATGDAQK